MEKFCVDCRYYTAGQCFHEQSGVLDVVTGIIRREECSVMRETGIGDCGRNGKLFVQKSTQPKKTEPVYLEQTPTSTGLEKIIGWFK